MKYTIESPGRLDVFLSNQNKQYSRAVIQKLISSGNATVNGVKQTKSGFQLRTFDVLDFKADIENTDDNALIIEKLYEDDDCVVINKPAGLLSHSKGAFNPEHTVASWLSPMWQGDKSERGGIVHRLDRGTSGVMICAKTPEAMTWLQKQFSLRKVKKSYLAVISGHLSPKEAIVDMPIERNPKKPQTFRVGNKGKNAVTEYKVLKETEKYSLVELTPETGRTHQLRVHMDQLGHAIVGDHLYGKTGEKDIGLYLHAWRLEITLPNRTRKTFEAPIPAKINEIQV